MSVSKETFPEEMGTIAGSDVNLHAIFNAMRDGIIVADMERRTFVCANSAMCRMLAYTERELLTLAPADIHPPDLSSVIDAMYTALAAGEIETVSLPMLRKDGTTFFSDISASHAAIQGRKCLIAVFRDVTDRRNAEAALRERETRLRRAESMGLLGHYSFDEDGHNFVCSDGLKEIWGFEPDSHPSFADWVARIHPEDVGWVTIDLRKCFQARRSFTFKHRITHPDGVQVTVHSRGEVAKGQPGAPPRWFGTAMDITERKGIENVLRESEERLRLVIHATHDGIWDWNILTHEAYFSPRWKEIAGYTGEELPNVDSSLFDLLHPDDKPLVEEALHRHFSGHVPFSVEFRLRHKDGTWRWILSRGGAIFDSDGQPVRMIGVITDITDRKRAEQALRNSQERLQLIFDTTTDHQGLFRVEPGGRFILETANRAWKEFVARVGLNAAPFVGQEMEEFLKSIGLTAEQIENRRTMYQKAAREKTAVHFTSNSPGPRQEAVEVLLTPVLDQNGECTHVLWNARVVTARVKAEAELRERDKKLRLIFNAHRDLQSVIRIEPDGRFVTEDFNRAHLDYARPFIPDPGRYVERERVELLRAVGIQEEEIEEATAQWREVAAKKALASYESTYTIGPDRRRETAIVTIVPILSPDGVCTHLLWTGHLITERKRAEEELRKRERELEEAQSIGHIASWTWDIPEDKLVWSDEVYRILGFEPQQFPPPDLPGFLKIVHPDDREKVEREAWAAYEARAPHDFEHRIVRPDGTVRVVRTRSRLQLDSAGQPLRMTATLHDVTEERQAAAREAQRLLRLKKLSELSMMLAGDPSTVFERIVRMIGELFEVRGVCLSEIVGRDAEFRAVYAGGKVLSNAGDCPLEITPCSTVEAAKDIRVYERVQELFPRAAYLRDYDAYTWCGFPSLDNEGKVVAVTALVDDKPRDFAEEDKQILGLIAQRIAAEFERGKSMAERARMEEELRDNQNRLEEAQQMAHLGSYTGDVASGRMEWSDELYRIYELDRALSAPDVEAVLARAHPDDRARMRKNSEDLMRQAERSGTGHLDIEHRLLMPDGRIKYLQVQAVVSPGGDGRPHMRGTIQDITERKRAEQEREKLQTQLAQAQKMESIGRLAGGVAHDFNNMLTVILGYAALSKAALTPDSKQFKYMAEIVKAAERSKEITQKLLGFSRKQIIAPVPSNLNDLIADLHDPLARLIGEDIELVFHPQGDLWKIVVDHSQVNQILLNLVVNARDAMPRGGKLTIETENVNLSEEYCRRDPGARPGPHVLLAVSDTGVGMDEETLSHIFEPFFTTKDREKGTGLGLATVYGVVKQNGGLVGVYSEPAHGTTLKIYFPVMAGKTDATEIRAGAPAPAAGHGTILLVEDDELVRDLTKDALESIGYMALVAANPQQAIDLYSRAGSEIRLVLTDVVMPGMNGMELRDRLRTLNPAVKVLFMSGYTSNVVVSHGVLTKGVNFIQKPFTIEDLGPRLEEVMASD